MPGTAIFVHYTREGFIIVADGRQGYEGEGGPPPNEEQQKIFSISDPGKTLAWAFFGYMQALGADNSILFNFHEATRVSIDSLRRRRPANADQYMRLLGQQINDSLARSGVTTYPDADNEGSIAKLVLAGYYKRKRTLYEVRFFHRQQQLAKKPKIQELDISHTPAIWGSIPLLNLLVSGKDSRLLKYRTQGFEKLRMHSSLSLAEAQEMAVKYIEACSDPIAADIDPLAHTIGGHTHCARVTRREGFKWVIPPKSH